MIYDKIKAYGFQALCMVLLILLTVQTLRLHHSQIQEAEATTTLANERSVAASALVKREADTRVTENGLSTGASETRKVTYDQVTNLTNQRDALLKRVRNAEANANKSSVSKACTTTSTGQALDKDVGGELLARIGEKDVDEAIRADTLRLHLKACYLQYDAAREALSK